MWVSVWLHLALCSDIGDGWRVWERAQLTDWSVSGQWLCIVPCGCSSLPRSMILLETLTGFFGCHQFLLPLGSFITSPDEALAPSVFGRRFFYGSWFDLLCFIFGFVGDHKTRPFSIPVKSDDSLWHCSVEFHSGSFVAVDHRRPYTCLPTMPIVTNSMCFPYIGKGDPRLAINPLLYSLTVPNAYSRNSYASEKMYLYQLGSVLVAGCPRKIID